MTRRVAMAFLAALATVMVATAARAADPKEIPITIENNRFSPEEIRVKAEIREIAQVVAILLRARTSSFKAGCLRHSRFSGE